MPITIAFVSQKGGVSKSTQARAFACEANKGGLKTKVADLDIEQGTFMEWHRRRLAAGLPPAASVEFFSTAEQALKESGDCDVLVLDGPARASKGTLDIARFSDLIVQPTGTSLDDLVPAVKVFNALVKEGIPRVKLVFTLARFDTDAEEAEAREYLQLAGYEVIKGGLPEYTAYRQAMNAGQTVTETRYKSLRARADELVQSLIDKIGDLNG